MTPPRRSFRLVCSSAEIPLVEAMLRAQGYAFEPDPFFALARRLTEEPRPLGSSLAAFFGLIYIQDRASMLPPVALAPTEGAVVLDMCASPGSKTGQLAGMVGASGMVMGNEPSPSRLATLRRNLHTMGLAQTVTCCQSGESLPLPGAAWDNIQLDPPCSGWGTVERNPKVLDIWKDDKITPLLKLQRALLREAERLLRPGGVMVYSTCTTNIEENEAQVRYAEAELGLVREALPTLPGFELDAPLPVGERECDGVWRLSPRPGDTQGFFVARLRKPESFEPAVTLFPVEGCLTADKSTGENKGLVFEAVSPGLLAELGVDASALPGPVGIFGDSLHVVPRHALEMLPQGLRWQGMYFGKSAKGGDIRLSPRLRIEPPAHTVPVVELEGTAGLALLQGLLSGQSINWDGPSEKAEKVEKNALLRWNGLNLGRARLKNRRLLWSER